MKKHMTLQTPRKAKSFLLVRQSEPEDMLVPQVPLSCVHFVDTIWNINGLDRGNGPRKVNAKCRQPKGVDLANGVPDRKVSEMSALKAEGNS